MADARFCIACGTALAPISVEEDSGPKTRLRCPACGFVTANVDGPLDVHLVYDTDYFTGGEYLDYQEDEVFFKNGENEARLLPVRRFWFG